ncbi:MAG: hypothetical protein HDR88_16135 [Bacteroides sp.]|nr:hypothetical protein [Bacteroides sp.]
MYIHPKTKAKLRAKHERRKEKLTCAIRGLANYFRLAGMRYFLRETDEWLRSRLRVCT